jgi:hypothetical protein
MWVTHQDHPNLGREGRICWVRRRIIRMSGFITRLQGNGE